MRASMHIRHRLADRGLLTLFRD
jgi:hypothetical protein